MILSKLPEMENDEIYQSEESPSPTFIEATNTVDESIAVAESDVNHLDGENLTTIENIVEDDAIVISEDDNVNDTATAQKNGTSNNLNNEASSGNVFKLFKISNK